MKRKVLVIDDEPDQLLPLRKELENNDYTVKIIDFPRDARTIRDHRPDFIVLDLVDKSEFSDTTATPGNRSLNQIREEHFCPIILYSGFADLVPPYEHPLIQFVTKGADSETEVLTSIQNFSPVVNELNDTMMRLEARFRESLETVLPVIGLDNNKLPEIFQELFYRRLAATIRSGHLSKEHKLSPLEQYVFPPIGDQLLVCDVIKTTDRNRDQSPENYRMILTPSCDLQRVAGRSAKVDNVLVVRLFSRPEPQGRCQPKQSPSPDNIKKYADDLNQRDECIFLPGIEGIFPSCFPGWKALELIPLDHIAVAEPSDGKTWIRYLSVDSPFREHLVWMYTKEAGRIGLPNRDFASFAEKLIRKYRTNRS